MAVADCSTVPALVPPGDWSVQDTLPVRRSVWLLVGIDWEGGQTFNVGLCFFVGWVIVGDFAGLSAPQQWCVFGIGSWISSHYPFSLGLLQLDRRQLGSEFTSGFTSGSVVQDSSSFTNSRQLTQKEITRPTWCLPVHRAGLSCSAWRIQRQRWRKGTVGREGSRLYVMQGSVRWNAFAIRLHSFLPLWGPSRGRRNLMSGCFRSPSCSYFDPSVLSISHAGISVRPSQTIWRTKLPSCSTHRQVPSTRVPSHRSFLCFLCQRMQEVTGSCSCNPSVTSEGSDQKSLLQLLR